MITFRLGVWAWHFNWYKILWFLCDRLGSFLFGWLMCMSNDSGIIGRGFIHIWDVGYFDFVVGAKMEHMVYFDPWWWMCWEGLFPCSFMWLQIDPMQCIQQVGDCWDIGCCTHCIILLKFYYFILLCNLYLGAPRWTCNMWRFPWDKLDELYCNIVIRFYVII